MSLPAFFKIGYVPAIAFGILITASIGCAAAGQTHKINTGLKARLDSIGRADQEYRSLAGGLTGAGADSLAELLHVAPDSVYERLMALQSAVDSTNLSAVARLIHEYGYPGASLVGTPTNEVAYYVIQHSPRIRDYLPLLRKAALEGELPNPLVAMMEDRLLVEAQQEQIYGTQVWGNLTKDSVTGVAKPRFYFNPIRDAKTVNKRRRLAGFTTTIEVYAAEMHIPYVIKRPWWWKK